MFKPLLTLCCLLVVGGCTSVAFENVDPDWHVPEKSLAVAYIPAVENVYLEISTVRGQRYAEFELSVAKSTLAGVLGVAVGTTAGYHAAVASAAPGTIVTINPVGLGVALAAPLVQGGIEAARQSRARKRAARFNELDHSTFGDPAFYEALQSRLPESIDASAISFLNTRNGEYRSNRKLLKSFDTDQVMLVATVAAFTPRFEALEVTTSYEIYKKQNGEYERFYANSVLVQSVLRSGLDGHDTRNEVNELVDEIRDEKLHSSYTGPRTTRAKQLRIEHEKQARRKAESNRKRWHRQYRAFDVRDKQGDRWFANDAEDYKNQLHRAYNRSLDLVVADLASKGVLEQDLTQPPGYVRDMYRVSNLDALDDDVYRLEEGPYISIGERSRMIPISSD